MSDDLHFDTIRRYAAVPGRLACRFHILIFAYIRFIIVRDLYFSITRLNGKNPMWHTSLFALAG